MHDPETVDPAQTGAAGAPSGSGATPTTPPAAAQPAANAPEATAAITSATVTAVEQELQAALAKANENYDLYLRARADGAVKNFVVGVEMTSKELQSAFEKNGLSRIDPPKGEKFDPHKHQAISSVPAPDGVPPNHVVAVLQKGWMISDRVLRPALVTVAASN